MWWVGGAQAIPGSASEKIGWGSSGRLHVMESRYGYTEYSWSLEEVLIWRILLRIGSREGIAVRTADSAERITHHIMMHVEASADALLAQYHTESTTYAVDHKACVP